MSRSQNRRLSSILITDFADQRFAHVDNGLILRTAIAQRGKPTYSSSDCFFIKLGGALVWPRPVAPNGCITGVPVRATRLPRPRPKPHWPARPWRFLPRWDPPSLS